MRLWSTRVWTSGPDIARNEYSSTPKHVLLSQNPPPASSCVRPYSIFRMQGASLCWTIAVLLMARAATAVATEETAVADATVVDAGATTMATSTTTVVSGIGCNCIGCCLNSTATQMPPSPHRTTALRLAQLARAARRGGSRAQQSPPPPLAASPPPAFDRRFCCDGCRGPNPGEVSAHVRQACSTPPNQECAAPDHKDRRLGVCCPRVQCKGLQQLGHRGGPDQVQPLVQNAATRRQW